MSLVPNWYSKPGQLYRLWNFPNIRIPQNEYNQFTLGSLLQTQCSYYCRNKASSILDSIYLEQCVKKTTLWGLQCILRLKARCADPIPCNRATEEEEHDKHVLKNDPCCTHKFCIWHHAYRRGAAKDHKQILDLCTGSTQPWLTEKAQAASVVIISLHVFTSRCIKNIQMLPICHDHRHQSCGSVQLAGKPRTRTNDSSGIASPVVWCAAKTQTLNASVLVHHLSL